MSNLLRCVAVALAAASGLSARALSAQLPIPIFGVAGGVSHFDLAGAGSSPIAALSVDIPVFPMIAEGSLTALRPLEQNGVRRTYVIPEAQLQFQLFPMLIRPYVGVG